MEWLIPSATWNTLSSTKRHAFVISRRSQITKTVQTMGQYLNMNCSSTNKSAATFINLSITVIVISRMKKKMQYKKVINKHPNKRERHSCSLVMEGCQCSFFFYALNYSVTVFFFFFFSLSFLHTLENIFQKNELFTYFWLLLWEWFLKYCQLTGTDSASCRHEDGRGHGGDSSGGGSKKWRKW